MRIKALKIVGIGLIMWGLTLLWPELNLLLASPLQLDWLVGAAMILLMLYFWSERQLVSSQGVDPYGGEPYRSEVYTRDSVHSHPTRPYTLARARDRHSRATRPMPQS